MILDSGLFFWGHSVYCFGWGVKLYSLTEHFESLSMVIWRNLRCWCEKFNVSPTVNAWIPAKRHICRQRWSYATNSWYTQCSGCASPIYVRIDSLL